MSISKQIEPPDSHFLRAAEGWLELGNATEALKELAHLSPQLSKHPEVLVAKWNIHAKVKDWPACINVSKQMTEVSPEDPNGWINHGNAIYFSGKPKEAYEMLLPIAKKFPQNPSFAYNLACYATQMGKLKLAWDWFSKALKVGDPQKIKSLALEDTDLEPLWPEIRDLAI